MKKILHYEIYISHKAGTTWVHCDFLPSEDEFLYMVEHDTKLSPEVVGFVRDMISLGMPESQEKEGEYLKNYEFAGVDLGRIVVKAKLHWSRDGTLD